MVTVAILEAVDIAAIADTVRILGKAEIAEDREIADIAEKAGIVVSEEVDIAV